VAPNKQVFAVMCDLSMLYMSTRDMGRVKYSEITEYLKDRFSEYEVEFFGWTNFFAGNAGQLKFINILKSMGWTIRKFLPKETSLISGSEQEISTKFIERLCFRHDASMAYAMAAFTFQQKRICLISGSFPLAEPLMRAARMLDYKPFIMFPANVMDLRWWGLINQDQLEFISFDDWFFNDTSSEQDQKVDSSFADDFLVK